MIDDSQLVNSLLEQGFLDRATLKEGIQRTKASGKPLYETLIFARLVAEDKLVALVSDLLNVPTVTVEPHKIRPEVRDMVPASMARRNRVIPLEIDNDELVLGMVDPIDVLAMDEVATHTGVDIRPVLVGPSTIAEALEDIYGVDQDPALELAEDVLASFDNFDVEGMMDEVMAGEEWSDLFEDGEEASTEDSAVLSRDMRDRPSTDVLAEEDLDDEESDEVEELPELEIIEELGKPSKPPNPYASLENWDVDDAITSGKPGPSQILSAQSAEELFRSESSASVAMLEAETDDHTQPGPDPDPDPDPDDDVVSEVLDTETGKTSVGLGIDHLEDGALGGDLRVGEESTDDKTGRTSMGIGARIDAEEEPDAPNGEDTDYGALGRAILKSGPDTKRSSRKKNRKSRESTDANVAPPRTREREDRPTDPEPEEKQQLRRAKSTDEKEEELESEDGESGKKKGKKRPSQESPATDVIQPPSFDEDKREPEIESGVDAEALAVALARLLIEKGILTSDEVLELASRLSKK